MENNSLCSNEEKQRVWESYQAGRPVRVPLRWNVNPRLILLDPKLNLNGYDFQQYFNDPQVHLEVQAQRLAHITTELNRTCDSPVGLPDQWDFVLDCQNIYDSAYFGAKIQYRDGQVPDTVRPFCLDDAADFLERSEIEPESNPWLQDRIQFHHQLSQAVETFTYLDRRGHLNPFMLGFDGPLTVAVNLFGEDILIMMGQESELAKAILEKITREVIKRNQYLASLFGDWSPSEVVGLADDSVQTISVSMYQNLVLPAHRLWFDTMGVAVEDCSWRGMHLCGDATHLFPLMHQSLQINSFDTGYPVDHGKLRRELGPKVEISGGPRVAVLRQGTPEECYQTTTSILQSGTMDGGRFILQEGNNLPPGCPIENLMAVYQACLDHGRYNS